MPTKSKPSSTPKPNGRQLCPRCDRQLGKDAFAPKSWGKPSKWCRECKSEWRRKKAGVKKAAAKVKPRQVKKASGVPAST